MARVPKVRGPLPKRRPPAAPMEQTMEPAPKDGTPGSAMTPEEVAARLQLLGASLAKTRKEAMNGRAGSGIEDIWREDEEHYEGIDDVNRGSAGSAYSSKPPGQLPANSVSASTQSIEFPNITMPYVDAAAARVGDILLPTDAKGWSIKETPIPELLEKSKGKLPTEVIFGMAEANVPEEVALHVADEEMKAALALIAEAKEKAKRAEKRIEDWHVEGQFAAELRQVIDDAAKIGTGVLKGPMPVKKRTQMFRDGALAIDEVKKPVSKRVDVWNCFPDPACGQSIHNGRYHWERGYLTAKQLEALRRDDSYIATQIDACLDEGPQKKTESRQQADGRALDEKGLYEVWYYYGYAEREDMEAAGCPCKPGAPVMIPAAFTMVNDRVIKGALNHLDTGEFPYDYFPWQRRKNSPWGMGVSRKIRTAQRIVAAATRVMLTNGGRAAGPLIVMKRNVKGANGKNDIEPWKIYYANDDEDVSKAFAIIEIPDRQNSLAAIVQFGLKMAEDTTGLPLLLQGQAGSAPDTLGGQQLVDRNATGVLRRIARTFDDCITEPHIRRYYVYLLIYGPEDLEKGEFVIDAKGSTALVEREVNRQEAMAMLQASLNPAFGIDPKKAMAEKLRADNRNPQDFQYSEEDQKKIDEAQAQKPQDPRIAVAQLKAQADAQEKDKDRQFEAQQAEEDRKVKLMTDAINERIAGMKLSGEREISFADMKAMLAKTVMELKTQKELAAPQQRPSRPGRGARPAPQVAPAAVEPPGRAPNGRAFQA